MEKNCIVKQVRVFFVFFFPILLFSNPFPGMEVEEDFSLFVETDKDAPIQENTHFRYFRWGESRPTVLQREDAIFFTNVLQSNELVITLFRQDGKKWFSFLRQEVFIGYVFQENKLILGYYLIPFFTFREATNIYERVKGHFFRQYSDRASYSLGFINPPYGGLEGVLAFVRWKTTNTFIELTLERDKVILDITTRKEITVPFVLVMSYTDIKQQDKRLKAGNNHP